MSFQFFRGVLTPLSVLLFLFGFGSLQSMSVAQAATTYVPTDQPTIQAAIDAATPGDVIVVAPGTYWETIDFQGKAITLRSSNGPSDTTIDGTGLGGSVVQAVSGEGPDTILEGFTITGGFADVGGGGFRAHRPNPPERAAEQSRELGAITGLAVQSLLLLLPGDVAASLYE